MPSIFRVQFPDGEEVATWNIEKRVGGFQGVTRGLDVKLVQYLLFHHGRAQKQTGKGVIAIAGVDGVWGRDSKGALDRFESENKAVLINDDACDPATPGLFGKMQEKTKKLKIQALQGFYVKAILEVSDINKVSAEQIQTTLMNLPENELDIPSDLKQKLVQVRAVEGL